MARIAKNNKANETGVLVLLLILLTFAQIVIFGLVALIYHQDLMNRYFKNAGDDARRVNDFTAVKKPMLAIMFGPALVSMIYLGICYLAFSDGKSLSQAAPILLLASPLILIWLWLGFVFFRWLAVAHFGVIVDPGSNRIVFQFDQESYDLKDYLKLKFIRDLPKMDEIRLSDIDRITRKYGWDLYILGSFGSRRITFTNKQKRDECIHAIQSSGRTSAKVPMEFGI